MFANWFKIRYKVLMVKLGLLLSDLYDEPDTLPHGVIKWFRAFENPAQRPPFLKRGLDCEGYFLDIRVKLVHDNVKKNKMTDQNQANGLGRPE